MSELTQELKLQFQSYDQEQLNDAFIDACRNGDLEIIRYLLTSSELKEHADIHINDDDGFHWACASGYLEIVRYLLTSPELKEHVDIHSENDGGFRWACEKGHLDIVRYLLTSSELTEHSDIHAYNDCGFQWACERGHLEVVRYLLTSPELNDHADIHTNDDMGFQWACNNGHLELVVYLLGLSGERYIDFQKTKYNLDWSIENQYHDIVKAMITSLYKNDMMVYLENISKIEQYCLDNGLNFQNWQEEMVTEDVDVNSHSTELFL